MLKAYRGLPTDKVPVAPEFWNYYPAKLLGVDMIEFARDVPFHWALKQTFEAFGCEGWGIVSPQLPNPNIEIHNEEKWLDERRLEVRSVFHTAQGAVTARTLLDREEPGWAVERPIKDFARDLPVFEIIYFPPLELMDVSCMLKARDDVGESYLLEAFLGMPFTDFWGSARDGGLPQLIFDLYEHTDELQRLQTRYIEYMREKARLLCMQTPFESFFIGCCWSCNSLIGPHLWRQWDKPVLQALAEEIHRHGRLLHIHLHGKCLETVPDLAEIGVDCVCPFERPPGGDVEGLAGLKYVADTLQGRVTMNGNVHTVNTLIRGTPEDVRREVREIWEAFRGTQRVIIGTGDQVGRETPEENLWAMIEEARSLI